MALYPAINHGSRKPALKVNPRSFFENATKANVQTTPDVWRWSGINGSGVEEGATALGTLLAIVTAITAFAQTEEGKKIIDKATENKGGNNNSGGNTSPGETPEGPQSGGSNNNLSAIAPLAILFALGS